MMSLPIKEAFVRAIIVLASLLWASSALAQNYAEIPHNPTPVGLWITEFKQEAMAQGIPAALLDKAFANFTVNDRVIELDRSQPEGTKTVTQYLQDTVTQGRKSKGRNLYLANKALLDKIGAQYHVQPRFIVALWGIETDFGGYTGNMSTIRSLATLAYDGRRSDYFRDELIKAFKIIHQGHITLDGMKGSWAGALGQCQFMPTSFIDYAVDYNGDGRKDIWNTLPDIFASIANYLHQSGWDENLTWGRHVMPVAGFDPALADDFTYRSLAQWQTLGVRNADGSNLPTQKLEAALTMPGDANEAYFLTYRNYDVLLKWNKSRYFATAVGTLADAVGGR